MEWWRRAAERRDDIIACIQQRGYSNLFDMSSSEASNQFLEGTGALVPDRVNGFVYVNLSERADERLAQQWADQLGYKEVVTFRSVCSLQLLPICLIDGQGRHMIHKWPLHARLRV